MKEEDFREYVDNRLKDCLDTLFTKSKEYSDGKDKHHNFKRAAKMRCQTPEQALQGMKTKHDVSLLDIIDDIDDGRFPDDDVLKEKIIDSINYLLLLESLILEHKEKKENCSIYK